MIAALLLFKMSCCLFQADTAHRDEMFEKTPIWADEFSVDGVMTWAEAVGATMNWSTILPIGLKMRG